MFRVLLAAITLLSFSPAAAQTDSSWLIGTWKGEHKHSFVRSDDSTFTFRQDGDRVVWELVRVSDFNQGGRQDIEAKGMVSKISDGTVDLQGTYTKSTNPRNLGQAANYSFKKKEGDVMDGSLAGVAGVFPITMKKVK